MFNPARILVVAPNKLALDDLCSRLLVARKAAVVKRVLTSERDLHALNGLEFDLIIGAEVLPKGLHPYLQAKVR